VRQTNYLGAENNSE